MAKIIGIQSTQPRAEINGEWKEVLKYEPGGFFGERALLRPDGKLSSSWGFVLIWVG